MGNKTSITYGRAIMITAIIASLMFSVSLFVPNAFAKTAHVEPGGPSNTSTTSIAVTTSTIPATSAVGSNATGLPKISINITHSKTYTVVLNGNVIPGAANTTITELNVTWGDGVKSANVILPVNHTYVSSGTFLITATVFQSDGKTNSASLSALVNSTSNSTTVAPSTTVVPVNTSTVPSTNVSGAPTTVAQQSSGSSGSSNTLLYVAIVVIIIIIVVIAALVMKKK